MATYVFSVDRLEIVNCRSKGEHNDSDWLSLVLTINDQVQKVGPFNVGTNLHHGDAPVGPWWVGPAEITETDNVTLTVVLTNHSHLSDINDQRAEAVRVESAALGAIIAAVGGAVGAAVGLVMAGLGEVFGWILEHTNPNCNGDVGTHTLPYPPGVLASQGTPHTVANDHTAPSSDDCGNPPITRVTYSVIDPADLRQFLAIHNVDGTRGIRDSFLKPGISLRSFQAMRLPDLGAKAP
jgi:hypothetical protein